MGGGSGSGGSKLEGGTSPVWEAPARLPSNSALFLSPQAFQAAGASRQLLLSHFPPKYCPSHAS